jgi:hypothetical protein
LSERTPRVLRDQRYLATAQLLERALAGSEQIEPAELDPARGDTRRLVQQAEQRIGGDRFPRAALPDQCNRLATTNIKADLF